MCFLCAILLVRTAFKKLLQMLKDLKEFQEEVLLIITLMKEVFYA